MKKWSAVVLCVLLLSSCRAFAQGTAPLSDAARRRLIGEALRMCAQMDACADEPAFVSMYTWDQEVAAQVRLIGAQGWESPVSATLYVVRDGLFTSYLAASNVDYAALSGPIAERFRERIVFGLATLVNSRENAAFAAAAGILQGDRVFLCAEGGLPEECLLCLSFGGRYDALCAFVTQEDGIVSARLSPVLSGAADRLIRLLTLTGVSPQDLFDTCSLPVI